ncbi:LOB domain-containing protein 12 [Linum grandiflorum]
MVVGVGTSSPCASCKLLRRRCAKDCIFAPYFPSRDPHKFAIVHKVFGASNVSKMLQELPVDRRADAVSSLVYEANARIRDPIYGCVGAISYLQSQVSQLQMQLALAQAQAEILCIAAGQQVKAAAPDYNLLMISDDDNYTTNSESSLDDLVVDNNNNKSMFLLQHGLPAAPNYHHHRQSEFFSGGFVGR